MTHQLDTDDFFIHRVQQCCAEARLNFFLVEPLWVEPFLQQLTLGKVWTRVLLNMHSEHHEPEDIFHRLVRLASEKGSAVIDSPEVARAAFDKARLHPLLISAGIHVPYTVIVPLENARVFQLSPSQKEALGKPFVIKPSLGYGRKGLVLSATSERDIDSSVAAWRNPHYLLQRKIVPSQIEGRLAYFRVYSVFGEVWCCWWNCFTDAYVEVTPEEMVRFNLASLVDIVKRIAALTGMKFFSSEIAYTAEREFVVIDYVNDQCHLLSQSANPALGVPDHVVEGIARRLVTGAVELVRERTRR
jgi:hypothetical protein